MKYCPKCNKEMNNVKGDFCVNCGERLIKIKKQSKDGVKKVKENVDKNKRIIIIQRIVIGVLSVWVLFLMGCIFYFGIIKPKSQIYEIENQKNELEQKVTNLNSKISQLTRDKNQLNKDNLKLEIKTKFIDENVVFVLDGYGNYYYTYDQMIQVTQGKSYSYWAYNKEQAINLGYRAWK